MNICFVIPTWNRADKLRECVESIASQDPLRIVIADNASTDHTKEVCSELQSKYPCVIVVRFEDHVTGSESLKRAVNLSSSDYTWTFGDDDTLMLGALEFVSKVLDDTGVDFLHVSESKRAVETNAIMGTAFEIANKIGLTDFTGFMSCNIAKTDLLKSGANSKNWDIYSTSSFPQSLSILDAFHDKPSMMLQVACVESPDETDDTRARWDAENVCWRYLYIGKGLKQLQLDGKLPSKVSEVFFRYLDGMLFGRYMNDFIYRAISPVYHATDDDWDCFQFMVGMVEGDRGDQLSEWVKTVRKISQDNAQVLKTAAPIYDSITKTSDAMKLPTFPISYLP